VARSPWTGVAVAAVLAGCGDGTGPGTVTLADPAATRAALSAVDSALAGPVVTSFGALATYIHPSPGFATIASSPAGPVVPDTLYGAIFTWDSSSARYARSQTTGGPPNGVRYVLYAVQPATGAIVTPLDPVGVADLLDESTTADTGTLHVQVRDTLGTAHLEYTATLTLRAVFLSATLSGLVTNGANRTMAFDVAAQLSPTTTTARSSFTLNDSSLSVVLDATTNALDGVKTVSMTYTISRPGEAVRLQGYKTTTNDVLDTLSAGIRVNGQASASVEGNAHGITFYGRDGAVIPAGGVQGGVRAALDHLRTAVDATLAFMESVFDPLYNLLSS